MASLKFDTLTIANVTYGMVAQHAIGQLNNKLKDLTQKGHKGRTRFYYKDDGRGFLRVLVDSGLSMVSQQLLNEGAKLLKESILGKEKERFNERVAGVKNFDLIKNGKIQNGVEGNVPYGEMTIKDINGNKQTITCRDYYGNYCADGLMMRIPSKDPIKYSVYKYETEGDSSKGGYGGTITAKHLVWFDPTALISINSDRNLILTRVAGRDYSRKELVSNGDVNFSVSGHIFSNMADVYPEEKVKEFIQCMKYKGVIEVNNIILDQFNIKKIVIKDFSLSSSEGSKQKQDYTFNAVGIQPESEVSVTEDTLFLDEYINVAETVAENKWKKFMKDRAAGTAITAVSLIDELGSSGISKLDIDLSCKGGTSTQ